MPQPISPREEPKYSWSRKLGGSYSWVEGF